MNQLNNQDLLNSSLRRCLNDKYFFTAFYEHFHQSSPEIAALFDKTDMVRLNKMMEVSLFSIIAASESNGDNDQDLVDIAQAHKGRNIKPEFYKYWEISLLATVAECDPEFDDNTRKAWKHVLARGVEFMAQY
ncbi:MAG: globin [Gammaproteobacteria bacterium]|nr:globin [Gammaproteobacteria bacterium]